MLRFALFAAIVGVGLFIAGYRDFRLSDLVQEEPQLISCETLARSGPGDNHHVALADFIFSPEFVYEEDGARWTKAWVPAVPLNGEAHAAMEQALGPDGSGQTPRIDFNVIVELNDVRGPDDVERAAGQQIIQGLVVNEIRNIDRETRSLLRQSYPNVNTERCWLVAAGQAPPTTAVAMAKAGGGILAFLCAGGLGIAGLRRRKPEEATPDSMSAPQAISSMHGFGASVTGAESTDQHRRSA